MTAPLHVTRLADRLAARREKGILSVPGCWDALTAILVERAGFEAGFVSGSAVSMAALGLPDLGYLTGDRIANTVARMRQVTDVPLIVDGDTGFGNALTLQRFIGELEAAGASAVQIEDQTFPKRCGHMSGKQVVPLADAVGRIEAALDARSHLLVVARTDALAIEGVQAAIDRAVRFVEAGADLVFIEGGDSMQDLAQIGGALADRVPLVHNLVEGGHSPTAQGRELADLGFAVSLHPLVLMHGLVRGAERWLSDLRRSGSTAGFADELACLSDMNTLTGAAPLLAKGARFGC